MKHWAMKIPANFLITIFILIASFSIHEFYFAALNKSNYRFPLFCVTHFEHIAHTDFLKAGGHGRGRFRKALTILCPLALACPSPGSMIQQPCQIMAMFWGSSAGCQCAAGGNWSGERGLGGQAVRVEDVSGRKRGRKEEFNTGRVSSSDGKGEWQNLV